VSGVIAYFLLPNNLENARFLTHEERDHARLRLLKEKPGFGTDPSGNIFIAEDSQEKFAWSEVRRGIFNIQVWLTACAYFAILSGLYSFGLFLPTIINDGGFTKNANQAQLLTVPPYAVATVFTVAVAIISDRTKVRGVIMLFMLPVAIAGYAAIANVHSPRVQYGMTFLMATGLYASVPPVLVWNSNNSAGHVSPILFSLTRMPFLRSAQYKRATTSALQLAIANSGGFVAAFIYPSKQGPLYHKGHTIVLGLLCAAWVL
jgi:Major Facilitator Superfamily